MSASVIRLENARIDTAAMIIRAHAPRPEFFIINGRHYVGSPGWPWDLLGTDADLVAVARAIVEAEVSS